MILARSLARPTRSRAGEAASSVSNQAKGCKIPLLAPLDPYLFHSQTSRAITRVGQQASQPASQPASQSMARPQPGNSSCCCCCLHSNPSESYLPQPRRAVISRQPKASLTNQNQSHDWWHRSLVCKLQQSTHLIADLASR